MKYFHQNLKQIFNLYQPVTPTTVNMDAATAAKIVVGLEQWMLCWASGYADARIDSGSVEFEYIMDLIFTFCNISLYQDAFLHVVLTDLTIGLTFYWTMNHCCYYG